MELCEISKDQNWKLIYRASADGFDADTFHALCDGVENTLTIIKSTDDHVFGGYLNAPWPLKGLSVYDSEAFIFSLVNRVNKSIKIRCTGIAAYGDPECGPKFGHNDLFISNHSNLNVSSSGCFGLSYEHPEYIWCSNEANSLLAGSKLFQTDEIEIFCKDKDEFLKKHR